MATEAKRRCGYRKAGGIYMVGSFGGRSTDMYPCCTDRPFTRGLTVAPGAEIYRYALGNDAPLRTGLERTGLVWIGDEFYDPKSFTEEAMIQGVSKRLADLPLGLKVGDIVAVAHRSAISTARVDLDDLLKGVVADHCPHCAEVPTAKAIANGLVRVGTIAIRAHIASVSKQLAKQFRALPQHPADEVAGIFGEFRFEGVELVLPESYAVRPWVIAECASRSVRVVSVPDDDADHVQPGWKLPKWLKEPKQRALPLGGNGHGAAADESDAAEDSGLDA